MVTRLIGASNSKGRVHGRSFRRPLEKPTWWQRLLGIQYERGSYFQMEPVDEGTAVRALDGALADSGCFSIEGDFGGTMEFYLRKKQRDVWIDCWFFDSGLSEVVISREGAPRLVQLLFATSDERAVLSWLRKEGATLVPAELAF